MIMENQFVPYEIALQLKEKGFDWNCLAVYMNGRFQIPRGFGMAIVTKKDVDILKGKAVLAPLWQQVIDWFRTEYKIDIDVFVSVTHIDTNPIEWTAWITKIEALINSEDDCKFQIQKPTFEEASQAAIEHALTLI